MPMKRTSSSLESALPSSPLSQQPPRKRSKTQHDTDRSPVNVTGETHESKPVTPRRKLGSAKAPRNSASTRTASRRKKSGASARAKGEGKKASGTSQGGRRPSTLKCLIGLKDPADICQEYILQTESRKLVVDDIYKCFLRDFPQLGKVSPIDMLRWQNRIRWFLSHQNRFVMVDQDTERRGSPYYYTVLPGVKGNRSRTATKKTAESTGAVIDSAPGAEASTAATCAPPSECGDPAASSDDTAPGLSRIPPKMESEVTVAPMAPLFPSLRGMLCGAPAPCLPADLPSQFGHRRTPLPGVQELFPDPVQDPTLPFVRGGFHPGPPPQTLNTYNPLHVFHSAEAINTAMGHIQHSGRRT